LLMLAFEYYEASALAYLLTFRTSV
jgi:hypothetical protein